MKCAGYFLMAFMVAGVLLFSSNSRLQLADAQRTVNFTKIFSENEDFHVCVETGCGPTINVLYEDLSTVALESDTNDVIWKGVAEVKKYGFKIDAVTSYPIGSGGSNTVNILVVMSK